MDKTQMSGRAFVTIKLYLQEQAEGQVWSIPSLPTPALSNSQVLIHVIVTKTLGSGSIIFPIFR